MAELYDIVILAGQSNAEGNGKGEAENRYEKDERVLWLDDDSHPHYEPNSDILIVTPATKIDVFTAEDRIENAENSGNFAHAFAREYVKSGKLQIGHKLLIVDAAVGGTGFWRKEWGVGNVLYRRLCDLTDAALRAGKGKIVAFLWHQGEHDAFEGDETCDQKYARYKTALHAMLKDYTERFGCYFADNQTNEKKRALPFIAGGFCNEWNLTTKERCDAVLRALREICAEGIDAEYARLSGAFVETNGLFSNNQKIGNGDTIHFCRQSLHDLGTRYYAAFCKLLGEK